MGAMVRPAVFSPDVRDRTVRMVLAHEGRTPPGGRRLARRRFDLTVKEYDRSHTDRREAKALETAKDADIYARPALTPMMIRNPDPKRRRTTRATAVRLPEPEGSEPGPSCLAAPNQTLAAARRRAPARHALA
jgi:hypothetical protein